MTITSAMVGEGLILSAFCFNVFMLVLPVTCLFRQLSWVKR